MDPAGSRLEVALREARERAKEILTALEHQGHPQTNQSSSVYLGLVAIQKRLSAGPARVPDPSVARDLEQLISLCDGKLGPVKPLLEAAARLARAAR